MIFYFSGTGNSAFVAERIGKLTKDTVQSLNGMVRSGSGITAGKDGDAGSAAGETAGISISAEEQRLVFVMPIYGWRMPRAVEGLIRRSELARGTKAYFVFTCGSEMGNAAGYVKRLCGDKGLKYMGCGEIVMPENYIAMFDAPQEEEAREIIRKAVPKVDTLAKRIAAGAAFDEEPVNVADRIKSAFVNPIFCRFIVGDKKFRADDRCTGCGRCAAECPVGDIDMVDGNPVWRGRCIHCMDCITGCPEEAIEYGGISTGKPRYRCPDV